MFEETRFKMEFRLKIWIKIKENKGECKKFMVIQNSANGFKVSKINNKNNKFTMNMQNSMCTYRKWDLTGALYCLAICMMLYKGWKLEYYVSKWYKKEYFQKSYEWFIEIASGARFQPRVGLGAIKPPEMKKMPSKLKKMRVREDWEANQGLKLRKKRRKIICQIWFKHGQNIKTCPNKNNDKIIAKLILVYICKLFKPI